jgi:23S rRNA pseudouridine2605 synthase
MTSSNENDSSPVVNPSATPSNADSAPSNADGQKTEGGERAERGDRRPRRQGAGGSKHPFNKKRSFNKDRPRREGGEGNGPREGGNQSAKLAPNPAESEALFASVVSGEFDAALDAPEVEEVKNPDGVNESEFSHQT